MKYISFFLCLIAIIAIISLYICKGKGKGGNSQTPGTGSDLANGYKDTNETGMNTGLTMNHENNKGFSNEINVFNSRKGVFERVKKMIRTNEEWKRLLSPEQFRITRQKGTERAFTGKYYKHDEKGIYQCVCCGIDLFDSSTKFESGSGWPSFRAPVRPENIRTEVDRSLDAERTEVLCSRCEAHLGHVFEDGPPPTYKRYCINSAALNFVGDEKGERDMGKEGL